MHELCGARKASLDQLYREVRASSDPRWIIDEDELARIFSSAIDGLSPAALEAYDALVGTGTTLDVRRIEEGINAANAVMSDAFKPEAEAQVQETIERTMLRGSRAAAGSDVISDLPSRLGILNGMTRAAGYYTNNYFNRQVMPALFSEVANILDGGNVDVGAYTAIRELMSQRLKSVPYWRVVANAAASHGYHYGVIKAGQVVGRTGYQLVAILDKKTSDICKALDGRQFWLADAAAHIERIATAEGDEIKSVAPWVKAADVEGKSANALRDAGIMVPPFHGNCRTTLVFVS